MAVQQDHDRAFPEKYSPLDINGRKLERLFIELRIALEQDLDTPERNYAPGLRMAMNTLIDIDQDELI